MDLRPTKLNENKQKAPWGVGELTAVKDYVTRDVALNLI